MGRTSADRRIVSVGCRPLSAGCRPYCDAVATKSVAPNGRGLPKQTNSTSVLEAKMRLEMERITEADLQNHHNQWKSGVRSYAESAGIRRSKHKRPMHKYMDRELK